MFFGQTIGLCQDWRGNRSVIVKRQSADRLPRSQLDLGHNGAELGQRLGVDALHQPNENVVEDACLGFFKATGSARNRVRHFLENLRLPLGRADLDDVIKFRDQMRRRWPQS